jgi:hypothetical protein
MTEKPVLELVPLTHAEGHTNGSAPQPEPA